MRKDSFRVKDGDVDLTDAMLAKVPPPAPTYRQFLKQRFNYTETRLNELFGSDDSAENP